MDNHYSYYCRNSGIDSRWSRHRNIPLGAVMPAMTPATLDKLAALRASAAEKDARIAEWEQKAATWLASPEAAQRLDGYRELAMKVVNAKVDKWPDLLRNSRA